MKFQSTSDLDVYPVGAIADALRVWRAAWRLRGHPQRWPVVRENARLGWRSLKRRWRQRSTWNGFLAEPREWPTDWSPDVRQRCGSGLTPNRARRSWERRKREAGCAR